jgi:hypothetical protein
MCTVYLSTPLSPHCAVCSRQCPVPSPPASPHSRALAKLCLIRRVHGAYVHVMFESQSPSRGDHWLLPSRRRRVLLSRRSAPSPSPASHLISAHLTSSHPILLERCTRCRSRRAPLAALSVQRGPSGAVRSIAFRCVVCIRLLTHVTFCTPLTSLLCSPLCTCTCINILVSRLSGALLQFRYRPVCCRHEHFRSHNLIHSALLYSHSSVLYSTRL